MCCGLVEALHTEVCRCDDVWVTHRIAHHLVPHIFVKLGVGVGGDLVAELIVVRDILAVGAAEPLVDTTIESNVSHCTVVYRKAWLQGTSKRRHLRLGECGIALQTPQWHKEESDGRALLSEDVTKNFDEAAVEVVVLDGVAVFVGSELLEPRHRVAVCGGRGENLHTLREPHHHTVRREVLGVNDEWNLHRAMAEAEADGWLHSLSVVHHLVTESACCVGVDNIDFIPFELVPAHIGRVGTPRVVLCRSGICPNQRHDGD